MSRSVSFDQDAGQIDVDFFDPGLNPRPRYRGAVREIGMGLYREGQSILIRHATRAYELAA